MWAAAENHAAAVTELLKLGADPNARSTQMSFPKASPAVENLITMTFPQGALDAADVRGAPGRDGRRAGARRGGADLNVVNPDGATALVLAIINAHYDLAAALLDDGRESESAGRGRHERALCGHRHADAVLAPGAARTEAVGRSSVRWTWWPSCSRRARIRTPP